jgi:hypothetical protein
MPLVNAQGEGIGLIDAVRTLSDGAVLVLATRLPRWLLEPARDLEPSDDD